MITAIKGIHMKNFVLSGGIILNFPSFENLSIAARSFAFTLGLVAVIAMPSCVFANDNDMEEIVVTARMVEESLLDSVELHQRSDVPYAMFLSGGIDSSALLAVMTKFVITDPHYAAQPR